MRKEGVIILCVFVLALLAANVYADNGAVAADAAAATPAVPTKEDAQAAQDKLLEKEVVIPENLQILARIVFGLKSGESISFNLLIVIIVILACFAVLMQTLLKFVPLFKQEWVTWAVAVVVTLITSSTGAFIAVTNFFFGFGENVQFLQRWGLLNLILIIAILAVFVLGLKKLLNRFKKTAEVEISENIGFQATAPRLK